jgi:serine/threonine protein kinase
LRNGFVKSGRAINLNSGLLTHIKAIPMIDPFLSQLAPYLQLQENLQSEKHAMSSLLTQNGQYIISQRPFIFTSIKSRFIHVYDEHETQIDWIVFQLLKGLMELHEHGIWHGDIKPENIMLTETNWIVYVDFASWKPKEMVPFKFFLLILTNQFRIQSFMRIILIPVVHLHAIPLQKDGRMEQLITCSRQTYFPLDVFYMNF